LPRLGGVIPILIFAVPFVLSVSGLGLVVAAIFKNPLSVQLVLAAIGMPFFFLAGFAWPAEVIPPAQRADPGLIIGAIVRLLNDNSFYTPAAATTRFRPNCFARYRAPSAPSSHSLIEGRVVVMAATSRKAAP
jgi:hypothetical protein